MAKIIWTDPSIKDVVKIRDYIAESEPDIADAFVERLMRSTERLAIFPESGVVVKRTTRRTYRAIFFGAYVIGYFIKGDGCYIAFVEHGRRATRWTS